MPQSPRASLELGRDLFLELNQALIGDGAANFFPVEPMGIEAGLHQPAAIAVSEGNDRGPKTPPGAIQRLAPFEAFEEVASDFGL